MIIVSLIYTITGLLQSNEVFTASWHAKLESVRQQIQVLVHSIGRHSAVDALNVSEAQGFHVSNTYR
jgi:hypothetical protein